MNIKATLTFAVPTALPLLATVLAIFAGTATANAETFTSAEFLKWERESQSGYFQASIGMAGLIAAQNNKRQADCLEGWYLKDTNKAEATILETMRKNGSYHPRAIIVAILQKQCGAFKYTN